MLEFVLACIHGEKPLYLLARMISETRNIPLHEVLFGAGLKNEGVVKLLLKMLADFAAGPEISNLVQ
jgi:hypothetical protein